MNSIKKCLLSSIVGTILIGAGSLSLWAFAEGERTLSVAALPESSPTLAVDRMPPEKTVPVTIYAADAQCENLLPQQVDLPADRSLDAAISAVFDRWNRGEFALAGYRVSIDETTRIATVDLRLDPSSQRLLISLSSCERFALFGSLSATLTGNPQWQISGVQFTDRGEAIGY
jgi:hypothetical protein